MSIGKAWMKIWSKCKMWSTLCGSPKGIKALDLLSDNRAAASRVEEKLRHVTPLPLFLAPVLWILPLWTFHMQSRSRGIWKGIPANAEMSVTRCACAASMASYSTPESGNPLFSPHAQLRFSLTWQLIEDKRRDEWLDLDLAGKEGIIWKAYKKPCDWTSITCRLVPPWFTGVIAWLGRNGGYGLMRQSVPVGFNTWWLLLP